MECPMCYELYDDEKKNPRNLSCGHTYCEFCLNQIFQLKKRIECPSCRMKHDPKIKPNQFSKNYVAADLATKQRELRKKHQFCQQHNEPLQFFCEDDQKDLCTHCLVDHSGHKFLKQMYSIQLIQEKINQTKQKLADRINQMDSNKKKWEDIKNNNDQKKKEAIEQITEEFNKVQKALEARKQQLILDLDINWNQQYEDFELEYATQASLHDKLMDVQNSLNNLEQQLQKLKFIKDDQLIKEFETIEESLSKELKTTSQLNIPELLEIPKIAFDTQLYRNLEKFGTLPKIKNPKICFFGEKKKILYYDIEQEEWHITQIPPEFSQFEFNYYSSAVTLPNGDIIILGGGVSSSVFQIRLNNKFFIEQKKSMLVPRKEHSSVVVSNKIFVLGGYNSASKQMLSNCECYDLETNNWTPIQKLSVPKCAFAASQVNEKFIYIFGGFDGQKRLSIIECYTIETDTWQILDVQVKHSLSNAAALSYSKDNIMLMGGGYDTGFSLEVLSFNIVTKALTKYPDMTEGRDLRNKIIHYKGQIYSIGGNNFTSEKFIFMKNEWKPIPSYKNFIQDNLDSWCCAYSFESNSTNEDQNDMLLDSRFQQNYNQYMYDPPPNNFDNLDDEFINEFNESIKLQ